MTQPAVLYKRALLAIIVTAALLRAASALYQGNTVTDLPGIYDQISYDALARRVVEGYGFSFSERHWPATPPGQPTAHWSYLYTLYLAATYYLFGPQPIIARLIQAVVAGGLQVWLTWRLGRRVFGPQVGLVAAGLCAAYIYFVYYAGGLLTETFYIIGILWSLDVAFRLRARLNVARSTAVSAPWRLWVELGLAIGVTTLLRQVFVLFVPVLFFWLWWTMPVKNTLSAYGAGWRRWPIIKGLFAACLVVAVLITPWTIRNYLAFQTLVPLNTNSGFALFWGNHPIYGTHFVGLLPGGWSAYTDLIPASIRHLNEAQLDQALLKQGLGFIVDDPIRFVLLSISRGREFFKFWPSPDSGLVSNVSRVASFGLALPFMVYGLLVALGRWRRPATPAQRSEIALLYLFVILYSAIHLASWALIRYRLPVDAVLLLFAALGLVDLAHRLRILNMAPTGTEQ